MLTGNIMTEKRAASWQLYVGWAIMPASYIIIASRQSTRYMSLSLLWHADGITHMAAIGFSGAARE